jgi:hypothetical protein
MQPEPTAGSGTLRMKAGAADFLRQTPSFDDPLGGDRFSVPSLDTSFSGASVSLGGYVEPAAQDNVAMFEAYREGVLSACPHTPPVAAPALICSTIKHRTKHVQPSEPVAACTESHTKPFRHMKASANLASTRTPSAPSRQGLPAAEVTAASDTPRGGRPEHAPNAPVRHGAAHPGGLRRARPRSA